MKTKLFIILFCILVNSKMYGEAVLIPNYAYNYRAYEKCLIEKFEDGKVVESKSEDDDLDIEFIINNGCKFQVGNQEITSKYYGEKIKQIQVSENQKLYGRFDYLAAREYTSNEFDVLSMFIGADYDSGYIDHNFYISNDGQILIYEEEQWRGEVIELELDEQITCRKTHYLQIYNLDDSEKTRMESEYSKRESSMKYDNISIQEDLGLLRSVPIEKETGRLLWEKSNFLNPDLQIGESLNDMLTLAVHNDTLSIQIDQLVCDNNFNVKEINYLVGYIFVGRESNLRIGEETCILSDETTSIEINFLNKQIIFKNSADDFATVLGALSDYERESLSNINRKYALLRYRSFDNFCNSASHILSRISRLNIDSDKLSSLEKSYIFNQGFLNYVYLEEVPEDTNNDQTDYLIAVYILLAIVLISFVIFGYLKLAKKKKNVCCDK